MRVVSSEVALCVGELSISFYTIIFYVLLKKYSLNASHCHNNITVAVSVSGSVRKGPRVTISIGLYINE